MPISNTKALELARSMARESLSQSESFVRLPLSEQYDIYRQTVDGLARDLASPQPQAQAMAARADDLINDQRHQDARFTQAGNIAADYVQAVNFPKFVSDLLNGVFQANLDVTVKQMDAYQKLLKVASQSVAQFINKIDATEAFGYLAENNSDNFSLGNDDSEVTDDNPQGVVLTDKDGNKVASPRDLGDNEIKAKIMDAKIQMAREQRAMLRETILMGITRLVVEKGNVKAGVIFDFNAHEKIEKADKAGTKTSDSSSHSIAASGGLLGSIFGGPSGGGTFSHQETQITVASAKSVADNSLAAKLTGSVDITFKSDYFKLDNFAQMYAPQAGGPAGGPAQAGAPAAAPGLPAAGVPAAAAPRPAGT